MALIFPNSFTNVLYLYLWSMVTKCKCYTGACVGLPNPIIWQRNLSSLKWDQITQVQESAGSAVGDISIHQGDQAVIQGVTEQKQLIYNVLDG